MNLKLSYGKSQWRAKVKNEKRINFFEEKVTPVFEGNLSKREAISERQAFIGKKKSFQIIFIIERSQLAQSTFNLEFCLTLIYLISTNHKICFYLYNQ